MKTLRFNDQNIQQLFGHEAAEDENFSRLRDYYFKGNVFERATSDLPLRVIVGHKGIGKSALIQVARHEDEDQGYLSILLRPDDVYEVTTDATDLLQSIRNWKEGLYRIIFDKCLDAVGRSAVEDESIEVGTKGLRLIDSLAKVIKPFISKYADLDLAKRRLAVGFLSTKKIRVYLDDLDRGWTASKDSILRLSSLLNALRDLANEHEGLQFRISLRADVYYLVRTSDESTDKVEGSVVWYRWTNHEILAMLVKRVQSFLGNELSESELVAKGQDVLAAYLDQVIEPRFLGRGKWRNIPTYRMLMSLIRRRPRDLVKLCTLAAQVAGHCKAPKISTDHFSVIFDEYSQGRLQDTVNEYRSELSSIDALLLNMRPWKKESKVGGLYIFSTAELLSRIDKIQQGHRFVFFGGRTASKKDLAAFMYKINFLTARKESESSIDRQYFEEKRYLSSSFTDFGYDWEIHPAFRWALQPGEANRITTLETLD